VAKDREVLVQPREGASRVLKPARFQLQAGETQTETGVPELGEQIMLDEHGQDPFQREKGTTQQ
jgi:hypothetical protein